VRPGCDRCSAAEEAFANSHYHRARCHHGDDRRPCGRAAGASAHRSSSGARLPPSTIVENDTERRRRARRDFVRPYERRARLLRKREGMRVSNRAAQVVGLRAFPESRGAGRAAEQASASVRPVSAGAFCAEPATTTRSVSSLRPAPGRVSRSRRRKRFQRAHRRRHRLFVRQLKLIASGSLPGFARARPTGAGLAGRSATSSRWRAHVRTSARQHPQRSSTVLPISSRETWQRRCGRSSEIEDGSGASDDGTTDAGLTYALLVEAISRRGGPLYAARDIAPNYEKSHPNCSVGIFFHRSVQCRAPQ